MKARHLSWPAIAVVALQLTAAADSQDQSASPRTQPRERPVERVASFAELKARTPGERTRADLLRREGPDLATAGGGRFVEFSGGSASGASPTAGLTTRTPSETEKITAWGEWKHLSGDLIVENNVHSIDVLNLSLIHI